MVIETFLEGLGRGLCQGPKAEAETAGVLDQLPEGREALPALGHGPQLGGPLEGV